MATTYFSEEREVILDAAAKVFNARGASQTTINDVARSAGFTITSIAHYYASMQDLAAACTLRTVEALNSILTIAEAEPTFEARLRRCTALYFDQLAEVAVGARPALINFWDMRALVGRPADEAGEAFVAMFRRLRLWFIDLPGPSLARSAQNARTFLVLSALLSAGDWIANFEREECARCGDCFADVLIRGIAAAGVGWPPESSYSELLGSPVLGVSNNAYLRVATELINNHGYRGASRDRIRRQFCMITNSIHPHYEANVNIVDECFERSFNTIRTVLRAAPRELGSGWARLCAIAASVVRHQHSQHGPLLRYYALSILPYEMRPRRTDEINRLASLISGVLSDGIIDKSIRPLDPIITAHIILAFLNAAAELKCWVQGINESEAAILFVRPSLLGVSYAAN